MKRRNNRAWFACRSVAWALGVFFACAAAHASHRFFSDNPSKDAFYDSSWGYDKGGSRLELTANREKLPIESEAAFRGRHSLRLHWRGAEGGDWGAAVAAPGWVAYDLSACTQIVFWVNAPAAIPPAILPDVALEDIRYRVSPRVAMRTALPAGVDADPTTWQCVAIPFEAFLPSSGSWDPRQVKTVYFYQGLADDTPRTLWLDEIAALVPGLPRGAVPSAPLGLRATGADWRVDLQWTHSSERNLAGYWVLRSSSPDGPFRPIHSILQDVSLYSDFTGENGGTWYYRVTAVNDAGEESAPSRSVAATTRRQPLEELLTDVQHAAFRYFYDYAHPISGLARERKGSKDVCASGGTGFGLMNLLVGVERGFITRVQGARRVLKIARFLEERAERYHGAWPHWIHGATGATIPFSDLDDGGDIVETAYVIQGLLACRVYFDGDDAVEREIRERATRLWRDVEWDWYRRTPDGDALIWHWSPRVGWALNLPVRGFNECMIVYILAIASPTHPVPPGLYRTGWAGSPSYRNGNTYYGYKLWVGSPMGGPLFFTHYSFLGLDPRGWSDPYCDIFANNVNFTRIQRAYCIENPKRFKGYGVNAWGLTASDNPWGYAAHGPQNDNGTLTPTAALSAMPYTPRESVEALKHLYRVHGKRLWGEYGFRDAFNPTEDWYADSVIAIDQGTIAPMIENYRSGLCWKTFMANPEIEPALRACGWRKK